MFGLDFGRHENRMRMTNGMGGAVVAPMFPHDPSEHEVLPMTAISAWSFQGPLMY